MGRFQEMRIPFLCLALCAVAILEAAQFSQDDRDTADSLDVRLNKFHVCLHGAESASHCMHMRPAELDDHVDDDDIGEMGDESMDDEDDEYGIGEGEMDAVGRGGGFLSVGGSMSLGGGAAGGPGE